MGKLVAIAGPSFSGKTHIKNLLGLPKVVTSTTRPIREKDGEVNGVSYFFLSREEFEQGVKEGRFIEHVEYEGDLYGTSVDNINAVLTKDGYSVVVMDYTGALNIKKMFPDDVVTIFISCTIETLEQRAAANQRGTSEVDNNSRLQRAIDELAHAADFDYIVSNDDSIETPVEIIKNILSI